MQKADRALASARLLLDAGDTDGACNRAYYAMFDAARAALSGEDSAETTEPTADSSRPSASSSSSPAGCRGSWDGCSIVQKEVRLLADYTGGSVEPAEASEALSQAEAFVNAVRDYLNRPRDAAGASSEDA